MIVANQHKNAIKQKGGKWMKFEEICRLYPDSWVLLQNPEYVAKGSPIVESGIFHYKNKDQTKVFQKAAELNLELITIKYTGGKLEEKEYIFLL